eukprot:XP_003730928.1 PREDICTED: glutathione S-transferase theta-1-like [Strongylocentrotus purpuratus]
MIARGLGFFDARAVPGASDVVPCASSRLGAAIRWDRSMSFGVGIPLFTGGKQHASEERLKTDTENLTKQLDKLENAFLQDNDWLAGDDISVADVLAVPEMMQNTVNGRDVTEGRPKLRAFVDRVKNRLNPVFDEVHEFMYAWRDSYNK